MTQRAVRAGRVLHPDNDHSPLGSPVTLRVGNIPKVPLLRPFRFWHGQFELWTITAPPFLFAASDFIDDPRLQHGETFTYAYGLQHRGLAVKPHTQGGFDLLYFHCLGALARLVIHRTNVGST